MAGLGLRFASGDRLVINGAALRFITGAEIRLTNRAHFLFGRQIMPPSAATTPASRIYFALQNAHVGDPSERAAAIRDATLLIDMFRRETTSASARHLLGEALRAAEAGQGYRALKIARRIMAHESAVLDVAPTAPGG